MVTRPEREKEKDDGITWVDRDVRVHVPTSMHARTLGECACLVFKRCTRESAAPFFRTFIIVLHGPNGAARRESEVRKLLVYLEASQLKPKLLCFALFCLN